jgi:hypothetical protein
MASLAGLTFNGGTELTDTHIAVQAKAGTTTWIPEFFLIVEHPYKFVAEALLWLIHSHELCSAITGEFATYLGGKLASQPGVLSLYVAYNAQIESKVFDILLQRQRTNSFFLEF